MNNIEAAKIEIEKKIKAHCDNDEYFGSNDD
jgi:hypothetical protein